jgi:hypothetical protein
MKLHPGEVARAVDDVRRRIDQALDHPSELAVEAPEQLSLIAEQPRPWWWVIRPSPDPSSNRKLEPAGF